MKSKKTKNRHRSRRSKRGTYVSSKTGQECKFRSSWEHAYMKHLDQSDYVRTWQYEPFAIEYVSNTKTGRVRKYYPDFLVETMLTRDVIEIKPSSRVDKPTIVKKSRAAHKWCLERNMSFTIVTENDLKSLGLI